MNEINRDYYECLSVDADINQYLFLNQINPMKCIVGLFERIPCSVYIFIIIILLVILISCKLMQDDKCKHSLKGAYLNYASTNAKRNGTLNPSDLAYPQVMEQRLDMEELKLKIKKIINAPTNAKVIINSGATESIANCIFWAKDYNKYGIVVGSEYDHSAVKDNCLTFDIPYEKSLRSGKINDRCCLIMITHVDSKTGEIVNVHNFKLNVLDKYTYEYSDGINPYNNHIRQYRPLVALDATQSIMKIPIDMKRWGLNAVFFSLHKIGGPMGMGVLVIDDSISPFKPLISGRQQNTLRGGTLPLQVLLENEYVFNNYDDFNERKDAWEHGLKKLKEANLKVYEPKGQHLYNTYLIDIGNNCPLSTINELARKNIYIGNVSACKNEDLYNKSLSGGTHDNDNVDDDKENKFIRITFAKSNEINDYILNNIIDEINKFDK